MKKPRHFWAMLGLKKDERSERLDRAREALENALHKADGTLTQTISMKDPRLKKAIEEANEAAINMNKKARPA